MPVKSLKVKGLGLGGQPLMVFPEVMQQAWGDQENLDACLFLYFCSLWRYAGYICIVESSCDTLLGHMATSPFKKSTGRFKRGFNMLAFTLPSAT